MICPLCGLRKARRSCPALGQQICAVCCGTKRLTEIRCPSDCVYLAAAREHPRAAVVREQQRDVERLVEFTRDLNERQTRLFLAISTFVAGYQPPEFQTIADEDVAEALATLASTYETVSRGVIYEHHATSVPAERLLGALKPFLAEVGRDGGSAFDRDAAVVLRRTADAARQTPSVSAGSPLPVPSATRGSSGGSRVFIDFLGRVLRKPDGVPAAAGPRAPEESRIILP